MTYLPFLAERLFNRPLAVMPDVAELIVSNLHERFDVQAINEPIKFESRLSGQRAVSSNGQSLNFTLHKGIAAIPVHGKLVSKGNFTGNYSGTTSYEGLRATLSIAGQSKDVSGILLDMDTPGGESTGMGEFAATIRALANGKPVWAIADGMACSAGYAIASAAEKICVIPSGVVGSIGVVCLHIDRSKQLETMGVKPTLIHAGAHKVDGNSFAPLTDGVRADIQASIDASYEAFINLVATNRPSLTLEAIRATEARFYDGNDAVRVGLADMAATFEETIEQFSQLTAGRTFVSLNTPRRGSAMNKNENENAPNAGASEAVNVDALRKEGEASATTRLATIMNAEGIKGNAERMTAALDLATKAPAMSATDVTAFVVANVKEGTKSPSVADRMADAKLPSQTPDSVKPEYTPVGASAIYDKLNGVK